ncbi:MAG: hypothetical protein U0638_10635 [Phycisphaerales bacterium]
MNDSHAQPAASTPAIAPGSSPAAAAPCECPRCGYDLSGAVAAWNHAESASCPMRGTCSECGLEFEWGDVLNPVLLPPPWSYEHARSRLSFKSFRTILVSLWPPKFWRDLRMSHPIHAHRLAILVAIGVPLVHMLVVTLPLATSFVDHALRPTPTAPGWADELAIIVGNCWPYSDSLSDYVLQPSRARWGIPTIMKPWPILIWLWWLLMIPVFLLLPITLRRCRVRKTHLVRIGAYSLVFAAGAIPLLTCTSRNIASGLRGLAAWHGRTGLGPDEQTCYSLLEALWHGSVVLSPLLCFAMLVVFWGIVASRYLRLPRPWFVSAVLTLLSALVAILLLSLLPGKLGRLYLYVMNNV